MKSSRSRRTSGRRAADGLLALVLALAPAACNYGFQGGGFPEHIRTIYIEPFDNTTPQFDLQQKLFTELMNELPAQLGVQFAGEEAADAVLEGTIIRYDDVAQNYQAGTPGGAVTDVFGHEVQIAIRARLIDRRDNVIRWETTGLVGRGRYQPDTEEDDVGQRMAIENIIEQIIDGAQSQW